MLNYINDKNYSDVLLFVAKYFKDKKIYTDECWKQAHEIFYKNLYSLFMKDYDDENIVKGTIILYCMYFLPIFVGMIPYSEYSDWQNIIIKRDFVEAVQFHVSRLIENKLIDETLIKKEFLFKVIK